MENTRAKSNKTQNILKTCFSQTSSSNSDHQSTHSRALIGSNDDLLTEILLRIPVTSILRFKSVSKHWRWLLSHQRFTLLYNNLSITPGLFVRNMYIPFDDENQSTPPSRTLNFYPDPNGIRIIKSCNGLLLCCSDRGYERSRKLYVFNPTTKQFAIIPSVPRCESLGKTIAYIGLAFHHTTCEQYKVICIHRSYIDTNEGLFHIQIYSSSTREWKISNAHFYAPYYTIFSNGVYWNGAIHWPPSQLHFSYFDLNEETFKKLPLSLIATTFGGYGDGNLPSYFGESGGRLHIADFADRLHVNVYEMSGDVSEWFLKYKMEVDDIKAVYSDVKVQSYQHTSSSSYHEFEVIDVIRGEEEGDAFMVLKVSGKIIRYNVMDKCFKRIFDLTDVFHERIGCFEVHRYFQSLTLF